ncbi:MAG TPA: YraN family protein [Bacteroidales bacterium]|nr:YraN family protein [Bacteroidales bacterium]
MSKHLELGKQGEQLAVDFLKKKGFVILERNWRFHHKEVDIIAEKNNTLIFVEVKTRTTDYFGYPFEAVTPHKQLFLIEAANGYLENNDLDKEVRFDVVSIISNNMEKPNITHIPDAFAPEV